MLPSATVGTLEPRSLLEPIRKVLNRCRAHYLEAAALALDMSNKLVLVSGKCGEGAGKEFYVPYDKLVIAVGSDTNTHGVEGLEYCHFLKTIVDARNIRNHIMDNFEKACLPTTTDEERKQLLSFVVAGGGPTGVEFASEVYDMMQEDLTPYVSPDNPTQKRGTIYLTSDLVPRTFKKRSLRSYRAKSISHPQHVRPKNLRLRRT